MSLSKSRFIEMFGRLGCDDKKWGLVSLGEFCLLNPQKSELHNISDDTEVSFLPMSSVSENGELTLSERKLYRDVKSGFSYFAEGDVLFAKITPCMENGKGAVAHGLCNNIGFGSTEFHVLRAKTSVCNPYWLYELLSLKQFRKIAEQNMTGSAGQKRVPAKFLQNFKLSLPPIELQNEYVSISRQIDKSKFLLQKILEKLELLKKSRFIEMFGDLKENQNYRTILFSQCTKSMIKGPFGSDMKKSLYVPKGKDTYKVYIQLNAIQRNQSLGNYYISKDYFDKKISRFEVKPNDFIITCDGTLGKLLQLDENMEKGVISSSLLKITLDETVIDSSFFEILWTNVILPNLSRYTRNACLVHLPSVSTIGNLEFHLPDLYLQKEYTKLVKQIDKSKLVIQKSLEDLVGKS